MYPATVPTPNRVILMFLKHSGVFPNSSFTHFLNLSVLNAVREMHFFLFFFIKVKSTQPQIKPFKANDSVAHSCL